MGEDGTSDRGEVAHISPHGEPAEDAKEAYWDVKGDPADTVDNGDPEGSDDTSGGGVVDDGIHAGDLVEHEAPRRRQERGDIDDDGLAEMKVWVACTPHGERGGVPFWIESLSAHTWSWF